MCLKRIHSTVVYYNQPFFLSVSICVYVYMYIQVCYDFYIIMVFFIYEVLRGKSENYSNYSKFANSPYKL